MTTTDMQAAADRSRREGRRATLGGQQPAVTPAAGGTYRHHPLDADEVLHLAGGHNAGPVTPGAGVHRYEFASLNAGCLFAEWAAAALGWHAGGPHRQRSRWVIYIDHNTEGRPL